MTRFASLRGATAAGRRHADIAAAAVEAARKPTAPARPNKYGAKKVITTEGVFDSQIEHRRWSELKLLERAGLIRDLRRQVPFELVVNGVRIGKITIDHQWTECQTGARIAEDVKGGPVSRDFPLRKKLLLALHDIDLQIWPERKPKARKRR